jgi:ATP-dependent Lon protease
MDQDNLAPEPLAFSPSSGVAQRALNVKQNLPEDAMIVLPLRNAVLFPATLVPFVLGRPASVLALEEAVRLERPIGFVAQKDAAVEEPTPENLYTVGVVGDIRRLKNSPHGQRVWVQGGQRFKILGFLQTEPYLVARVQLLSDAVPATTDFEARIVHLRQEIARAAALLPEPAPDLASLIDRLTDPAVLIDCAASWLDVSVAEKQEILEMLDLEARLKKVAAKLARQIEVLEITKKIGSETKDALDRSQREFVLREQMKAIQKELGGSITKRRRATNCERNFRPPRCRRRSKRTRSKSPLRAYARRRGGSIHGADLPSTCWRNCLERRDRRTDRSQ